MHRVKWCDAAERLSHTGAQPCPRLFIGSCCYCAHSHILLKKITSYFTIKPFANQDIFINFISTDRAKDREMKKLTAQLSVGWTTKLASIAVNRCRVTNYHKTTSVYSGPDCVCQQLRPGSAGQMSCFLHTSVVSCKSSGQLRWPWLSSLASLGPQTGQ